mmetsp:Transcript_29446/g.71649  ORF Transcript_29446/g.71649 Transcript_29446/m.71649 type:complete len:82 (+) Transcript_29446:289-534(+)
MTARACSMISFDRAVLSEEGAAVIVHAGELLREDGWTPRRLWVASGTLGAKAGAKAMATRAEGGRAFRFDLTAALAISAPA